MNDIQQQKSALRLAMKQKRSEAQLVCPDAATMLCARFINEVALPENTVIASYSVLGSEIDPVLLNHELSKRGHVIALPVTTRMGQPLIFHRYAVGDQLRINAFGIAEPLSTAQVVEPDVLLVPLLAFDPALYRLGYGGGYYDRSINSLRARKSVIAIGLSYSCQMVDAVPRDDHDVRLDKIVTEIQVF